MLGAGDAKYIDMSYIYIYLILYLIELLGDVQWMTAGRGIIHEEYLSPKFLSTGGLLEMAQLWVNLPRQHKMTAPKYQAILKNDIPVINFEGNVGSLRVIAGEYGGQAGAATTFSPVGVFHITLTEASAPVDIKITEGYTAIVFVRRGSVKIGGEGDKSGVLQQEQISLLTRAGDGVRLEAVEAGTEVLILSGQPIDEPIAARGPFVMNTEAELRQAMVDYSNGNMGQ